MKISSTPPVAAPLYPHWPSSTLLVDAFVFVLALLARLDLRFPAGAVALAPFAAAVGEGIVVPRLAVALALVALLRRLLLDHLLALGACGQRIRHDHEEKDLFHDQDLRAGCCCGALCPGAAPGRPGPEAVPQPQTSEPFPRRSTRSR